MVTKLKVKDLAAELGVGHKEILQQLRDMDIQVKSFMSTLEDDEVDRVRQALRGSQTEVVRREVQPGVIVRRRTRHGEESASKPAVQTEPEASASQAETDKTAGESVAAAARPEPEAESKPVAESAAKVVARPVEQPARIIRREQAEPEKAEPAVKKTVAEPTATEVKPAVLAEPEKPVAPAEPEKPGERDVEPESKTAAMPTARIIHEPVTPEAKIPAEASAPAEKAEPKPEATSEEKSAPVAEAKPEEKSAPTAEAKPEQEGKPAAEAESPHTEKPEQPREERHQRKPRREVIMPSVPQVRIISRPEPGSVPPSSSRRPEFSAGNEGGGARPYTPRPGGPRPYAPRPGGQRPEGPRDNRDGARPPRRDGAGYPPRPGTPAAVPSRDGAEERRRKERRVVEFPSGGTSSEEERRKAGSSSPKKRPSFTPAPVVSEDGDAPMRLKSSRHKKRRNMPEQREEPKIVGKRKIRIDETIRLSDLAHQMGVKAQAIIKMLFGMGMMATINQALDLDTATLVASEFGHEVENVSFDEQEFLETSAPDKPEDLKPRPPVVTIMGHVDHGKTSLLDAIRKTSIASGEAGGITQHIGAYHVSTSKGEVVFLDTPGHEAFTAMRARGAQVTDIVVLVVAADDGVMDQTREAINHSKAAGVPIVVAVNKIDKEGADPDRVKRELAEYDLVPEEWGGTTIFANVSAKQRIGLDELLEMILLQAEVLELKANPNKPAKGHIVEAKLDKGRGPLGTVLIQEGTLKNGDAFVCGTVHGKVRAMFNDQGKKIKQAGPAIPVEIQGFNVVPEAGDEFVVVADDKVARRIADSRAAKQREKDMVGKTKLTLESFLQSRPDDEAKMLNLVLKADVQGSLEAITEAVTKLSTDEVKIQVVHGATGGLTESDVLLANASDAIIIGFNVRPTAKVKDLADSEHMEIRFYDIIYKLVGEIKDAMGGMLTPDIQEVYLGQAEVRNTFSVPKIGTVAGCGVVDGKLTRQAKVRLLRDGVVIYTGQLASLKRFKDDAKEVQKGYECGVGLENFNDIKIGDVIEAFETKEVARTID